MIYVDKEIKELISSRRLIFKSLDKNAPFDEDIQIGPGSIDLRLGNQFRKFKAEIEYIDLSNSKDTILEEVEPNGEVVILPNEVIIATTLELVILPADIAGFLTGRSSIARLGLMVQCCQDYIQPGHQQLIPLQLVNITDKPIKISTNIRICQLVLMKTNNVAEVPYTQNPNSKYKDEVSSPKSSRIGIEVGKETVSDFKEEKSNLQILNEIQALKNSLTDKENKIELVSLRKNISNALYIVLGAAISVLMPELKIQPFPSTTFTLSLFVIILCGVILYLAHKKYSKDAE